MKVLVLLTILALATAKFSMTNLSIREKGQLFTNFMKNHNKNYEDPDIF